MILNRIKAAGQVELTAEEQRTRILYNFPNDKDMEELADQDYVSLMDIASFIKFGKFKQAYEKLNSLDTSVRDEVPQEVYRFLDKKTRSGDHPFGVIGQNTYRENKILRESIEGKSFCVTGTLSMPRTEAWKMIKDAGGEVHKMVSGRTNFLVAGAGIGHRKIEKAQELGVKVITEKELLHMVRGGRPMSKDPEAWRGSKEVGEFFDEHKARKAITLSEFKKLLLKEEMDISIARQIIQGAPYGVNKVKSYMSNKMDRKAMSPKDLSSRATIAFGQLMSHEKEAICSLDIVGLRSGLRPFLSRLPENCISDEVFVAKIGGEYFLCDTGGYDYARYVARLKGFDETSCMSDEDFMVSKMM